MKYYDYLDNEEENKIKHVLDNETKSDALHGIIVLGVDNYVIVNEMYGRQYGEFILRHVNDIILDMFRGSDIIVRLRGDEFIILSRNIKELGNIELLASKLIKYISNVYVKDSFYLTVSVGLSLYPIHGKEYSELKNKSYQSMLRAQANGKNNYRLYDSARTKALYYDYLFNKPRYEIRMKNDGYFDFNMAEEFNDICMNMFRTCRDSLSAMNSIMELCCMYLGFQRAYMFEEEELSEYASKMLRYAAQGYEFGKDSKIRRALTEDLQARLVENYSEITLINIKDEDVDEEIKMTLEDEGVSQLLFFPIYHADEFKAGCIFENMTDEIVTIEDAELQNLGRQLHAVQAYYFNSRTKYFGKENIAKIDAFDNLGACVYLIDLNTHGVIYANDEAMNCSNELCVGRKCYETLAGKDSPCEKCPLKKLDPEDPHATTVCDSYNYSARQWCRCIYSWLDVYENKNVAIMLAVDISDYVEGGIDS